MNLSEKDFLKWELENGIGFHNPGFVDLANSTVRQLADYEYQTILDYGCGTGVYAGAFANAGKSVSAWDLWEAHIEYVKQNAPQVKIVKKPITTDLLVWIEVAEHMTDEEIQKLFKAISPRMILFSSTSQRTAWDSDWGHINVKEQNEWIEIFARNGYQLKKELPSPTAWTKLFERIEKTDKK